MTTQLQPHQVRGLAAAYNRLEVLEHKVSQLRFWLVAVSITLGAIIGSVAVAVPAHADSLASQICSSIAGNPTEAGVYSTFHTLVTDINDSDTVSAIANHAINDVCPQWIPLVAQTARDLQTQHPQQSHLWA